MLDKKIPADIISLIYPYYMLAKNAWVAPAEKHQKFIFNQRTKGNKARKTFHAEKIKMYADEIILTWLVVGAMAAMVWLTHR